MSHPDLKPKVPPEANSSPYPSYETLLAAQQFVRPALTSRQLLFWALSGPLASNSTISIVSRHAGSDTREPYYNEATKKWHPISQSPMTEPKVSSITVHVYELQEWEDAWCEAHREHSYPGEDFEGVEWGVLERKSEGNGAKGEEGAEGDEMQEELQLLKCGGVLRPRGKDVSITVKSAASGEESFVTVQDYLSAVHPWLMSLKVDIQAAMGTLYGDEPSPGDEAELMVNSSSLDCLMIEREESVI